MKRMIQNIFGIALASTLVLSSCTREESSATGWKFNDPENGGFEKYDVEEQETGPGLVMVEGGTFTMGRTEQDVMSDWNARASRVTVASFYMDRTEVTNFNWLEYMYWMRRVYNKTYPHVYKKCLPDTLAWRAALGYREKYVNYYLRHPSYRDYPVVGVSWLQANDFCKWRTDRVNEAILVREGILNWHFRDLNEEGANNNKKFNQYQSVPQNMFSTENYLNGNYMIESKTGYTVADKKDIKPKKVSDLKTDEEKELYDKNITSNNKNNVPRDPYQLNNYDPIYIDQDQGRLGGRPVRMEDGILLPSYRLPTEAEWEFAALGLIGNLDEGTENINDRRVYPWDGHYVRRDEEQWSGSIQANFVRGKGDMMGIAGRLNDGADITDKVVSFWPNDYGLYHMAGNVSEWVMDVYRPLTSEVAEEFMPFRGNKYQTQLMVPNGLHDRPVKANENIYDVHGMKEFVNEFARVKYLAYANKAYDDSQKGSANFKGNIIDQKKLDSTALALAENHYKLVNGLMAKYAVSVKAADKKPITDSLASFNKVITNKEYTKLQSYADSLTKRVNDLAINFPAIKTVADEIAKQKPAPPQSAPNVANINNAAMNSKVMSRQDPRAYQFNKPSDYYISNNRKYSLQERKQFEFLDNINLLLDTAITLYNQGKTVAASAYIERVFFNDELTTIFKDDYSNENKEKDLLEMLNEAYGVNKKADDDDEGEPLFGYCFKETSEDDDDNALTRHAIFGKESIDHNFSAYYADPELTTWIQTLRNGLTEFVTTTKGSQRWRDVTVEENVGRINYRKDDYIDYLDGDIESSIYYNNTKRKEEINNGVRDPKLVMYQSEHENRNLNDEIINAGKSGWPTTLISDKSRVYKGGSWADRAYWLSAGNRRFLDEDKASATIGFRCAMDRVGSSRRPDIKE
jgi:gliding motility-associated lipoprotein GldJ